MANRQVVVLIDDDRCWVETLTEYLEAKGFSVLTAGLARAGLALLEEANAALVLVDYQIPDMNGLEFLKHLRGCNRSVAAVLLSGYNDPTLSKRALSAGAAAFVAKSQAPTHLMNAIREALAASTVEESHPWQRLLPYVATLRLTFQMAKTGA